MSRVMITGAADGLGLMAARLLSRDGHAVTVHARSERRAHDAVSALPEAEAVVVGDLSRLSGMRAAAEQANALGRFDAVIHNAGVGFRAARRTQTEDGLSETFAVNVLAPYLLTATMERPDRLIYLSSEMQFYTELDLDDLQWTRRRWDGSASYGETKLLDAMLALAVARRWPAVLSNAVTPGWVATRMGGAGAPDDLELGPLTQSWLAVSDEPAAQVSGRYFYHQREQRVHPQAQSLKLQDRLLAYCAELSGVELPPAAV